MALICRILGTSSQGLSLASFEEAPLPCRQHMKTPQKYHGGTPKCGDSLGPITYQDQVCPQEAINLQFSGRICNPPAREHSLGTLHSEVRKPIKGTRSIRWASSAKRTMHTHTNYRLGFFRNHHPPDTHTLLSSKKARQKGSAHTSPTTGGDWSTIRAIRAHAHVGV